MNLRRKVVMIYVIWNSERDGYLTMPTAPTSYTGIVEDARIFVGMRDALACCGTGDEPVEVQGMTIEHLCGHVCNGPRRIIQH